VFVVKALVANCQQYVIDHQNYEIGCQLAHDWLTVSRDRLNTCINVAGDRQHLEAAQNMLAVTTDHFLLMIVLCSVISCILLSLFCRF